MNTTTFRTWEQLTVVEQLQADYSDFYKDVHGIRPRFMSTEQWNSQEWLEAAIADLVAESKVVFEYQAEAEEVAIATFEAQVANVIAAGAKDRATALRWIFDGETDADYVCYANGLPYDYFKEAA